MPRLFARNERVLTLFDTAFGQVALIMVGALNVGSMTTVWAGDITPAARRVITTLPQQHVTLDKGAELGRFNMGSTVILLFQKNRAALNPAYARGCASNSVNRWVLCSELVADGHDRTLCSGAPAC